MPDGRLMVAGGHLQDDAGIATTYLLRPERRAAARARHGERPMVSHADRAAGRPDARAWRDATQAGSVVRTPEIFESNAWVALPGANGGAADEIPYYPRNFVAPDGRVFYAGERVSARWFEVDGTGAGGGRGRWVDGPEPHLAQQPRLRHGRDVRAGQDSLCRRRRPHRLAHARSQVRDAHGDRRADRPDPGQPDLAGCTATMSAARRHLNSTILPDGQVLITGGTRGAGFVNIDEGLAVTTPRSGIPPRGSGPRSRRTARCGSTTRCRC